MASTASSSTEAESLDTALTSPSMSRIETVSSKDSRGKVDAEKHTHATASDAGGTAGDQDQTAEDTAKTEPEPETKAGAADTAPSWKATGADGAAQEETKNEEPVSDGEDDEGIRSDLVHEAKYTSLARSLDERRKSAKKRSLQTSQYVILVEDRIKELEKIVAKLQKAVEGRKEDEDDVKKEKKKEEAKEPKRLLTEPAKFEWPRFFAPTPEESGSDQAAVDLLVEAPYSLEKSFRTGGQNRRHIVSVDAEASIPVERLRFNSPDLVRELRDILDRDSAPDIFEACLKPFKAIVPCVDKLRARVLELEKQVAGFQKVEGAEISATSNGDKTATEDQAIRLEVPQNADAASAAAGQAEEAASASTEAPSAETEKLPSEEETLLRTLEQLRGFVASLNDGLAAEIEIHQQLRRRNMGGDAGVSSAKVNFADLWHLFAPGDLIFDPVEYQALRVVAVRGGRPFLAREGSRHDAFDPGLRDPEPLSVVPQLLTTRDQASDFILTCFYLDFNGDCVGPVQVERTIQPFEGPREMRSLTVLPIEFADIQPFRLGPTGAGGATDDTKSVQQVLLRRGERFAALARSREVAHRDYRGLSLEKVRDQIDSQIVVDPELFYQRFPDQLLEFGLREPLPGDAREIQESYTRKCYCGIVDCTISSRSTIFDDYRVDKFRTEEFLKENQFLVRFTEPSSQKRLLSDEGCVVLFPRRIFAFVLRSRSWAALDVGRIEDLRPRPQSFEELVLPPEHKRIVEALVRTHSRGARPPEEVVGDDDTDRRDDLVRGKGKGVILLLHGVPGVGKTSTAECVAEYTKRPLFALTCGDIGDNAKDVEFNLNESFQLAHRWGCVMLLDEADVFLQARSRDRDLGRNAVVSVFLGMLEWYSGILFLTTNKIGTFDEAFKSRIHVSLYYKELNEEQTMEIWRLNLERVAKTRRGISFDQETMMKWMKKFFKRQKEKDFRPWNGRQIKNACQTAAALAEFQNNGTITRKELKAVADASAEFDRYLLATHGKDDVGRAEDRIDRGDDKFLLALEALAKSGGRSSESKRQKEPSPPPKKSSSKKSSKAKEKTPPPSGSDETSSDSD